MQRLFANTAYKTVRFAPKRFSSTATTPASAPSEVNHWKFERLISAALLPLTLYPFFAGPSKVADLFLTFTIPIHCHMGFQSIITDYLNVRKIGALNKVVVGSLYAATALTMYGLFMFNTRDVGITQFCASLWAPKKAAEKEDNKKH